MCSDELMVNVMRKSEVCCQRADNHVSTGVCRYKVTSRDILHPRPRRGVPKGTLRDMLQRTTLAPRPVRPEIQLMKSQDSVEERDEHSAIIRQLV